MTTEIVIELFYVMTELTNADMSLLFSVHRVLQLCWTLTKHCIFYDFMATAYEKLVKHLILAIRQLEQLKTRESCIQVILYR